MWRWDQGHLEYFQFDAIREIATYVTKHNIKNATRDHIANLTGLDFKAPATHSPWRNYARALKLCLLVSERADVAKATPVAHVLAQPGAVTCDEYMHFLASASTSPTPALQGWDAGARMRYPLLFALKYLLAKTAISNEPFSSLDEIIGAYAVTNYSGDEDDGAFIAAAGKANTYAARAADNGEAARRQARESLKVIAQISYLYIQDNKIFVSLNPEDAQEIFGDLQPILAPHKADADDEIRRISALFKEGSTSIIFEYPHTVINDVVESGFAEGSKVKKTHITIERNTKLRAAFFLARPTAECDVCDMDTKKTYPWTERVLDLHHLLPLSSGTRVSGKGTTSLDDLIAVCPSCHRAIHRYYDTWLKAKHRKDFKNGEEALAAYQAMKNEFPGILHA